MIALYSPPFNPQPWKGESEQVRSWNDLLRLLNKQARNEFTVSVPLSDGAITGRSTYAYQHVGTLGSNAAQYICGAANCTALSSTAVAKDVIRFVPFVVDHGFRTNAIACHIQTAGAAGAVARVGIFAPMDPDNGNFYPGRLLVDGGEVATDTTGVKSSTIFFDLAPGFYWAAYVGGTHDATPYTIPVAGMAPLLGAYNGTVTTHLSVSSTYAAFPPIAPSGATEATTAPPAVYLTLVQPGGLLNVQRKIAGTPPYNAEYVVRRVRMLKASALDRTFGHGRGVRVRALLTTQGVSGSTDAQIGYFDSDQSALLASRPKTISTSEDIGLKMRDGQTLQVEITYRGWTPLSMRDTTVLFDLGIL